jgi:hypothetical protein
MRYTIQEDNSMPIPADLNTLSSEDIKTFYEKLVHSQTAIFNLLVSTRTPPLSISDRSKMNRVCTNQQVVVAQCVRIIKQREVKAKLL